MVTMIYLFTLISLTTAANVLIYNPIMWQSHIFFMNNIADILHRKGHNVTVLSPIADYSMKHNSKENVHKIAHKSKYFPENEKRYTQAAGSTAIWEQEAAFGNNLDFNEFREFAKKFRNMCRGMLEDAPLMQSLRDSKFDIGITEAFELSGPAMLEAIGVRNIALAGSVGLLDYHNMITGIPQFTSFVPSWKTSFTHEMTFWERFYNTKLMFEEMSLNYELESEVHSLFKEFIPDFPAPVDILVNKTRIIFNNVNEFTETPRLTTNMIEYIGGANYYKHNVSKETEALLSLRKRTVLLSMGSLSKSCTLPLKFKKAFANAFSAFPDVTFVWKYEEECAEDDFDKTAYPNIEFRTWVAQNEMLSDHRLALFITHGGMNSIIEAEYSGTPMLVIPVFCDQQSNAINAERIGVAIKLDRTKIEERILVEHIGNLIRNDSEYRVRSHKLQNILKSRPEQYRSVISDWVDRLSMDNGPLLELHLLFYSEMAMWTSNDRFVWDDENPDVELVEPKILVSVNKNWLKFGKKVGRPPISYEIKLVNHGDHAVAFKIRTSDNLAYFVNQVYGVIPGRRSHAIPFVRENNSFNLIVSRNPYDCLPNTAQRSSDNTPCKDRLFILLAPIFHNTAAPASVFHSGASYEKLRVVLEYTGTAPVAGDGAFLNRRLASWCSWNLESTEKTKIHAEERTIVQEDSKTVYSQSVMRKPDKNMQETQHTEEASEPKRKPKELMHTDHTLPSKEKIDKNN